MPPAIEPGAPPMNIKMIVMNIEGCRSSVWFTASKPAVLGVID